VQQVEAQSPAPVQQQQQLRAVQPPQRQQQQQLAEPAPAPQQQHAQQHAVQQPPDQQQRQQQLPPPQQQLAIRQQQAIQQQQQQELEPSPMRDIEPQYAGLAQLVRLFDADRLVGQTELLDMRGTKLREGAMIMLTAHPTGALMVQGEQLETGRLRSPMTVVAVPAVVVAHA
jgi:hypothetical protein